MKTVTSFLLMQVIRSFFVALKAGKATEMMVAAIVTTFKGMGLADEVKLFGLSLICYFGGKGMEVPEGIAKLFEFTSVSSPQPAPQAAPPVQQTQVGAGSMKPAEKVTSKRQQQLSAAGNSPAKPQPQPEVKMERKVPETTPARTMDGTKDMVQKWIEILSSFVNGGRIDLRKTSAFTTRIFRTVEDLPTSEWEVFFCALKYANLKKLPIVDKEAYNTMLGMAPTEMLYSYVFDPNGLLEDYRIALGAVTGEMSPQLIGQGYALANAIDALDRRMEKRFHPEDEVRIKFVTREVERLDGPAKLVELLCGQGEGEFIPDTKPAKPPVPAQTGNVRIKGDLMKVVAKNNGTPEPPIEAGAEMPPPAEIPAEGKPSVH